MGFRESITAHCDCCDEPACDWMPGRARAELAYFTSHTAALRTLKQRNWYVDALVALCPYCYRHALRWARQESEPGDDE